MTTTLPSSASSGSAAGSSVANETSAALRSFLAEYRRQAESPDPAGSWFRARREAAMGELAGRDLPAPDEEAWRGTNLAPVKGTAFRAPSTFALPAEQLAAYDAARFDGSSDIVRLTFVNGRLEPSLSSTDSLPPGLTVSTLADAMDRRRDLVEPRLATLSAPGEPNPFVALNAALWTDGAFVHVARGAAIEKPIAVRFVSTGEAEPTATHPRNLIVLEEGAAATLVESYFGAGRLPYLTNAVTEVHVDAGANLHHVKIQRECLAAWNLHALRARLGRGAVYDHRAVNAGSAIAREDLAATLAGEGAECALDGVYVASGTQHLATRTTLDHAVPHCHSHELYKGILDDRATGVFTGYILVRQDAQKTDAIQSNRALLLSDTAGLDTRPQLEIYADDVKCTHGATVGQLQEEEIFYLRSRGIPEADARSIMVLAFACEVLELISLEPLRVKLEAMVWERFGR